MEKEIDCDQEGQEDLVWNWKLHSDSELARLALAVQSLSVGYLDLDLSSGWSCSQFVNSCSSKYTKIELNKFFYRGALCN